MNLIMMRYKLEYFAVLLLRKIILKIPVKCAYFMAELLGLLLYYVIRIRRKMMFTNLTRVFPEKSASEINGIIKRNYIKICKSAFEYFLIQKINTDNFECFGWLEDNQIIDEITKQNRGVILLGGHFDNPELVTNILRLSGYQMVALVKKQNNPFINAMFSKIRGTHGVEVIYKGPSVKDIFRRLKEKKILATVADIAVSSNEGIVIDFCGIPTPTPIGPAKFGLRTNASIIPVFSYRMSDNRHRIKVFRPLTPDASADTEDKQIVSIMEKYNKLLEDNIRKYPDEWFWMHNRWKHK